jgi:hypothetical protein
MKKYSLVHKKPWLNQHLHRVDRLMSKHLSSGKVSVHSPITFIPGGSKCLGSPSLGVPTVIYRPPLGFETSKIKSPKVGGRRVEKISVTHCEHIIFSCAIEVHASYNWTCKTSYTNNIPPIIKQ